MSRTMSAKDICSAALRAIGHFPVTEGAPDGEQLREAMSWLDRIRRYRPRIRFSRSCPTT